MRTCGRRAGRGGGLTRLTQKKRSLICRGLTGEGGPPKRRDNAITGNAIVVTTLGRARDKPFVMQAGWDLVVIDECLSIQNDTALQTMEAWRQVASSRAGVLMLSATFFRSK